MSGVRAVILDKGYCSVYAVSNAAAAGNMPIDALTLKYQSFYGELSFETSPRNIGPQEGVAASNRVRILQNRDVINHDTAVLSSVLPPPADAPRYDVMRAYHGTDEESGELITDLTLERLV